MSNLSFFTDSFNFFCCSPDSVKQTMFCLISSAFYFYQPFSLFYVTLLHHVEIMNTALCRNYDIYWFKEKIITLSTNLAITKNLARLIFTVNKYEFESTSIAKIYSS